MKKHGESGQGMTEFALILALVVVAAILILAILGPALGHTFHNVADQAVNSDVSNLGYRMTQTAAAPALPPPVTCYTLTLNHSGSGSDPTASPANSTGCSTGLYAAGESILLSGASPSAGWQIISWTGTGNNTSTSSTNSLTMPAANASASVNYAQFCFLLTLSHTGTGGDPVASPANSSGCPSGQYISGASISLSAVAGSNYKIGNWSGTSNDSSTVSPNSLTMPAFPTAASVNYISACSTLSLSHTGTGGDPVASPANSSGCPSGQYLSGASISLSAAPGAGWQVASWSGTSNNSSTLTTNALSMPATATAASVNYTLMPGWVQCATETWPIPPYVNACNIPGVHLMRYGSDPNWNYLTVTNSVYCDNDNFGPDPYPNVSKACYYWYGTWSMSATNISPATGSTLGGTSVTLSGTGLMPGATGITFGGVSATNIVCNVAGTSCSAKTPAHTAGNAVVTVSIAGQSTTVSGGFTYGTPAIITSLSKAAGSYLGGTVITITGTGFSTTGGTSFTFGGAAATSVTCSVSTSCTATTPAGTAGIVDVVVTVNSISTTLSGGYTFLAPPTLSSLSVSSGLAAGGTVLTINGTNFSTYGDTSFKFGLTAATGVTCSTTTTCTATTPAHAAGLVSVSVTVDRQTVSVANAYTFLGAPTFTAISRATGSIAGGTVITITGTNFDTTGNTSLTFGVGAATSVSCSSTTTCTATTPAQAAGIVSVVVKVGTQTATLSNGFNFLAAPTITSLSTTSGTAAGGTTITTILGTNFSVYNDTSVLFDTSAAISVHCTSSTTCTATTPAHAPGVVNVSLISEGQTDTTTNTFTYVPDLQSLSPNSGIATGGTTVTLNGAGFVAGSTTVKFGGTSATNVSCSADGTSCTVTTPSHTAGAVDVLVTVNSQSDTLTSGYTYVALLTCNSVTVPGLSVNKGWYFTFTTTLSGPIVATWTLGGSNSSTVYIYSGTPSFPTGNPTSLPSPNNPLSSHSSSGANTLTYNNASVGVYTIFYYVTGSNTSSKTPTITFYGTSCP